MCVVVFKYDVLGDHDLAAWESEQGASWKSKAFSRRSKIEARFMNAGSNLPAPLIMSPLASGK